VLWSSLLIKFQKIGDIHKEYENKNKMSMVSGFKVKPFRNGD
jgi:hypothetical protein